MQHQHHSDTIPPYTDAPRPPRMPRPAFWMISLALIFVVGSWLPLVLAARARSSVSQQPRIALVQDMGVQPKYREQQSSLIFADGRADRPEIIGTVARGKLHADDHFYLGYEMVTDAATTNPAAPRFFDTFPKQVKVDEALLHRGQERFNIYCSACHGLDGKGHGPVNERALELMNEDPNKAKWTQVADVTSDPIKARPVGHIYNTINVGIRSMPGYGTQVPAADRWAIVSYVRALQQARNVSKSQVPADAIDRISKSK
ncbi:MAG TPA: cytochrome c [Tepidisphaeraceae bacterium]|nr:cytochrome c [Tepidisphaeraceae bacterium]